MQINSPFSISLASIYCTFYSLFACKRSVRAIINNCPRVTVGAAEEEAGEHGEAQQDAQHREAGAHRQAQDHGKYCKLPPQLHKHRDRTHPSKENYKTHINQKTNKVFVCFNCRIFIGYILRPHSCRLQNGINFFVCLCCSSYLTLYVFGFLEPDGIPLIGITSKNVHSKLRVFIQKPYVSTLQYCIDLNLKITSPCLCIGGTGLTGCYIRQNYKLYFLKLLYNYVLYCNTLFIGQHQNTFYN